VGKMKLNITKEDAEGFEMEIEGEGHTLCNLLIASLNKNDEVEFAAYKIEHPLIGKPKVFLKLKEVEEKTGDKKDRFGYKKLIKNSLKELIETIEELEKKFKKAV
jgi:DNA-directed RNA polymerase subunit L